MNGYKVWKNLSYKGKVAGAVLGAIAVTECVFIGTRAFFDDLEGFAGYMKEVKNPTIYKVKTKRFQKPFNVRKSHVPGDTSYVMMPVDLEAVNKKPFRVNGDKIKGGK